MNAIYDGRAYMKFFGNVSVFGLLSLGLKDFELRTTGLQPEGLSQQFLFTVKQPTENSSRQ